MTTDMSFDGRVVKLTREAEFRGGSRFLDLQEFLVPDPQGDEGLPLQPFPLTLAESRGARPSRPVQNLSAKVQVLLLRFLMDVG